MCRTPGVPAGRVTAGRLVAACCPVATLSGSVRTRSGSTAATCWRCHRVRLRDRSDHATRERCGACRGQACSCGPDEQALGLPEVVGRGLTQAARTKKAADRAVCKKRCDSAEQREPSHCLRPGVQLTSLMPYAQTKRQGKESEEASCHLQRDGACCPAEGRKNLTWPATLCLGSASVLFRPLLARRRRPQDRRLLHPGRPSLGRGCRGSLERFMRRACGQSGAPTQHPPKSHTVHGCSLREAVLPGRLLPASERYCSATTQGGKVEIEDEKVHLGGRRCVRGSSRFSGLAEENSARFRAGRATGACLARSPHPCVNAARDVSRTVSHRGITISCKSGVPLIRKSRLMNLSSTENVGAS